MKSNKMQQKNILKYELVGLDIEVIRAKNAALVGLKGRIVEETKNMLTLACKNDEKKLIKNQIVFTTTVDNTTVEMNGSLLVGRPEERMKKRVIW